MLNLINTRILISGATVLAAAAIAIGATFAFFSDTETSEGNTLVAGEIDLKVDNTCYYNEQACIGGFWGGNQANGECTCTWQAKNLSEEDLFFDIDDIKPGDREEDTISLTVGSNDAWVCADVTLRSDDNNSQTEPEGEDGDTTPGPIGEGELADAVNFLWWADDGDNVLEDDETTLPSGPIGNLSVGQTATVDLADSNNNIWGDPGNTFPGDETRFIGKAWCFGDILAVPLPTDQGNNGRTPVIDNNADQTVNTLDGGYTCDGSSEDNQTQTDSFSADIGFRAVQARNNSPYECTELAEPPGGI